MDAKDLQKQFWKEWASYSDSQQISCIAVQDRLYPGKDLRFLYKKSKIFGIEGNFNTKEQTFNIQFYCNKNGGEEKFQYLQSQKQSLETKIPGIRFKEGVRRVVKTLTYPQINVWVEVKESEKIRLVNIEILTTIIQFYDIFFIEYN